MTPVELVLSKLKDARKAGNGWCARCPAHEDRKPSLSVSEGADGRALVRCYARCKTVAVCRALGLSLADLMPERTTSSSTFAARSVPKPNPNGKVYPTADDAVKALEKSRGKRSGLWFYYDANGQAVGAVVRWDRSDGKDIRPVARHPDGWRIGAMPDPRPLFGLPELAGAKRVFVVEGEQCAEAARKLGFVATTSSGGAMAAAKADWSPLARMEVVILPDHDDAGREYANDVAAALEALKPRPVVKMMDPQAVFGRADLPKGYDIADALAECVTDDDRNQLRARIERAASQLAPRTNKPSPGRLAPDLVCLADVTPTELKWLWFARFPLGRLTVFVGRPGEGKSLVTCDMSARVSTGTDWPDGTPTPQGDVLLICAEDDPADTIVPRLIACGADTRRVHLLRAARVASADGEEATVAFDLSNIHLIRDTLDRLPNCKLVVVDPVGSYLGGGVDSHRDNEVRAVLAPLGQLAADRGLAVVLVAHTRKAAADFADDAILGSRAFSGIARSVLHLVTDPEDRDRKLLLAGKNNLAKGAPGLAFAISGDPPRVAWEPDPVELNANDVVQKSGGTDGQRGPAPEKREAATQWLVEVLSDGPKNVKDLETEAEEAGLSWGTVRRAQRALNIKPLRTKFQGVWQWALPDEGVHQNAASRSRSSNEKPEHLRDSPDEIDGDSQTRAEGAHDTDNLSTFGNTAAHNTNCDGKTSVEPIRDQLFENPATNLPD